MLLQYYFLWFARKKYENKNGLNNLCSERTQIEFKTEIKNATYRIKKKLFSFMIFLENSVD